MADVVIPFTIPACACCGGNCTPIQFQCRRRGGLLSLCGFDDFVVTWKKFLRRRVSGNITDCLFDSNICASPTCPGSATLHVDTHIPFVGGTHIIADATITPLGPAYVSAGVLSRDYNITVSMSWDGNPPNPAPLHEAWVDVNGTQVFANNTGTTATIPISPSQVTATIFYISIFTGVVGIVSKCITLGGRETIRDTWDLTQNYDANTCILSTSTDNSKRLENEASLTCPPTDGWLVPGEPSSLNSYTLVTDTPVSGLRTITGTGICTKVSSLPDIYRKVTETVTDSRSVEDTESNAIMRFQASTAFGGYAIVGAGCILPACCLAQYQDRGASFDFIYADAQWEVKGVLLLPNRTYELDITYFRRPFASGLFTKYRTDTFDVTTDALGKFDEKGDVPNDIGFETYTSAGCIKLLAEGP